MTETSAADRATGTTHVDVLIVGAGLSGIGAAHHLTTTLPRTSYVILESRQAIGGTWDLFRYPGIRSDSDMYTLGYNFKPWLGEKSIADGASIKEYIEETAREAGIDQHIRFGHRVLDISWSTADARWTVTAEHDGELVVTTASFVFSCSGYYRYDEGFTPDFAGADDFAGRIVHPQHWPEDLDYSGKKIVVIGSGATAVTLAPNLAKTAEHVTLLQRSPSYILSLPSRDPLVPKVRKLLPQKAAYAVMRAKNSALAVGLYVICQKYPKMMRGRIRKLQSRWVPKDFDIDTHLNPRYDPWDQRLCLVPDNDLFRSIRQGEVEMVTDRIERFTEKGIRLESGRELDADIIVTATGLNLVAFGGAAIRVDGDDVDLTTTMAFKGMMLSGVPNFAFVIGYTNASWTLKADMVCEYVCKLLKHMESHGYREVRLDKDEAVNEEPFLDFAAGYVLRSVDKFPKQGSIAPWRLRMNYFRDLPILRYGPVTDKAMSFSK